MADIKTPNLLSEITTKATSDLLCIWDIDEAGAEKMKRMTIANFLDAVTITGGLTVSAANITMSGSHAVAPSITNGFVAIWGDSTGQSGIIAHGTTHASVANHVDIYAGGTIAIDIDDSQNVTIANGELSASSSARFAEKIVIPLDQPSSLENGCIWIA